MFPASLVQILVALVIVGLILYLLEQIPIDAAMMRIIRIVLIVFMVLWLISILAGWPFVPVWRGH